MQLADANGELRRLREEVGARATPTPIAVPTPPCSVVPAFGGSG